MMSRLGRNLGPYNAWLIKLRESRLLYIALAHKMARIAWAVLTTRTPFLGTAY